MYLKDGSGRVETGEYEYVMIGSLYISLDLLLSHISAFVATCGLIFEILLVAFEMQVSCLVSLITPLPYSSMHLYVICSYRSTRRPILLTYQKHYDVLRQRLCLLIYI